MKDRKQIELCELPYGNHFTFIPQSEVSLDHVYRLCDHSIQLNRLTAIRLSDGEIYSFEPDTLVYTVK